MTALLTAQLCDTKAVATTLQIFKLVYILFSKCSHAGSTCAPTNSYQCPIVYCLTKSCVCIKV